MDNYFLKKMKEEKMGKMELENRASLLSLENIFPCRAITERS